MKILLDECLPLRLRKQITGHDVFTVDYMGWKGIPNGQLLTLAAAQKFDLLLTVDRGTLDQLPSNLPIAVLVLRVKRNSLKGISPLVPKILATLANVAPNTISFID